jgi:hypothetical protein
MAIFSGWSIWPIRPGWHAAETLLSRRSQACFIRLYGFSHRYSLETEILLFY